MKPILRTPRAATRSLFCSILVALTVILAGCIQRTPVRVQNPSVTLDSIRVLTYNIHHGEGLDGRLDPERIAAVITGNRTDIAVLQEVDRGTERTNRRDLVAELADLTGLSHTAFGKNIDHQGGDYGNAILSRYPLSGIRNTHLRRETQNEQRGVLQALARINGQQIAVLAVHLDHESETERLIGTTQLLEEILPSYESYPVIVAGDFNDLPESDVHSRMKQHLADAWEKAGNGPGYTFPSDSSNVRIDFVFYSEILSPVEALVPHTTASDHRPVLVVFVLTR